jgi:hypothetical protein
MTERRKVNLTRSHEGTKLSRQAGLSTSVISTERPFSSLRSPFRVGFFAEALVLG